MLFHEIGDFHGEARLWHSSRVVQSPEICIFMKKYVFFLANKNTSRIVTDIVAGVGALRDHSKSSKSMIFDKNQ